MSQEKKYKHDIQRPGFLSEEKKTNMTKEVY